jgi:predicted amidohydrolase YtcJ
MSELLLTGPTFTGDPHRPWVEAVLVRDGTIVAVGSVGEVRVATRGTPASIDASRGVVLPGFVDAHAHVLSMGAHLARCELRAAQSMTDITGLLHKWIAANPQAPRVLGSGWLFSAVPDGQPTRHLLDEIERDRPVYLDANDLHSVWTNSAGLAELGIDRHTPDPVGGRIVRDPSGSATGLLLENAAHRLAWPVMMQSDSTLQDQWLDNAIGAYHAAGTTAAVDMALDRTALHAFERRSPDLPALRIVGYWLINRDDDPARELAQVAEAAALARSGRDTPVRVVGVKLIVDGTIDACTAALSAPYTTGAMGELIWDRPALERVVLAADEAGLQIAMHAIGDLAVRTALDVLEEAAARRAARGDDRPRRHRIEHLEYVHEADVARLAALGVTASMQPVHCDPAIMPNWEAMLGPERARRGFAWPEYVTAGATLAFGTDTPTAPHQPLPNMYIAATRKSPGDPTLQPHRPDFSLPLAEAITHATRDAAWACFAENDFGMIRPGLSADLVVLDRNPFDGDAESLLDGQVTHTLCDGIVVHGAAV